MAAEALRRAEAFIPRLRAAVADAEHAGIPADLLDPLRHVVTDLQTRLAHAWAAVTRWAAMRDSPDAVLPPCSGCEP